MGFSVSGSAAVIFLGMFIAFGTFHTAASTGFEAVSEAEDDQTDRSLTRQNTAINLTAATWNGSALTVRANNTGASALAVDDVDLLADNEYQRDYATDVDGDSSTDLWLPGERLTIEVTSLSADPGRVKLVTGPGVAAVEQTVVV